jgi:hypothetical protein
MGVDPFNDLARSNGTRIGGNWLCRRSRKDG